VVALAEVVEAVVSRAEVVGQVVAALKVEQEGQETHLALAHHKEATAEMEAALLLLMGVEVVARRLLVAQQLHLQMLEEQAALELHRLFLAVPSLMRAAERAGQMLEQGEQVALAAEMVDQPEYLVLLVLPTRAVAVEVEAVPQRQLAQAEQAAPASS
jgi:hypothetical protein